MQVVGEQGETVKQACMPNLGLTQPMNHVSKLLRNSLTS